MNNVVALVFAVVGGLALFLYGLSLLSGSLQKIAGNRLRNMLGRLTDPPVKGIAVGIIATALVQSSSVTTVTILGFLNSGLLNLTQGIAIILGTEIGTTVTAQIVSFKIGDIFYPFIAAGFFLFFFGRTDKQKNLGQIILGFGILFLGMRTMSAALRPLASNSIFTGAIAHFARVPFLGILVGAALTGIIQSSSATTGLVIAMSSQGIIELDAAVPIILGANIGTCVTALIASIGSSTSAKRAAVAHLMFNMIGVLLFYPFLNQFQWLVSFTSSAIPRQIANAHTIFNGTMVLIMLPAIRLLASLVKTIVPGEDTPIERGTKYLDEKILHMPTVAIGQAEREALRMADIVTTMLVKTRDSLFSGRHEQITHVFRMEELVDDLDNLIEHYLTRISNRPLSEEQQKEVTILVHSISDMERVADHAHNIAEITVQLSRSGLSFSGPAKSDLENLYEKSLECYVGAIQVLAEHDETRGKEVLELEATIDRMQQQLEEKHLQRLDGGSCESGAGPLYLDIARNLERISDHAHNIAYVTLIGF